jgi:hypothetical protein
MDWECQAASFDLTKAKASQEPTRNLDRLCARFMEADR